MPPTSPTVLPDHLALLARLLPSAHSAPLLRLLRAMFTGEVVVRCRCTGGAECCSRPQPPRRVLQ